MADTDDQLDAKSRQLLAELEEMRELELRKRTTARSTDEFHALARDVDQHSRRVFEIAHHEFDGGREDSPLPAERAEQERGDWTDGEPG